MTDGLRVIRVAPADPRWDAFVRAHGDSSFCHLSGWGEIVENVFGRQFMGLAAVDGDGLLHGVLPLVRVKAPFLGHSLLSMPYLNYGGPIGSSQAVGALVDAARQEADDSGAGRLQLRCRAPIPGGLSVMEHKILVLLDLPDDAGALWQAFPSKLRSQIRKPEKAGMRIEFGAAHVGAFYDVFSRNMRDLGTPVYSRRFFEMIARTFDESIFGAVYVGDRPVAAGCGFLWRGEFEMTWASSNRDFNSAAPNMLLYWGFMRELIGRRARTFNFGRSTPDGGTHRFKKQWGGEDAPLPWVEWDRDALHRDALNQGPDTSSSGPAPIFKLASAVWQRMPLPMANLIGPPLAARLPWW